MLISHRTPFRYVLLIILFLSAGVSPARAQTFGQASAPATAPGASSVPRWVPFNGQMLTETGEARTGSVVLIFGLYADQKGGTPMWIERHVVTPDRDGRYAINLGSLSTEGLPAEVFAASAPKWLGVQVEGEPEQPRFMLLSVPYALKAGDADTIAGKPATDFVMSEKLTESVKSTLKTEGYAPKPNNAEVSTIGTIPKFSDTANTTVDSILNENAGKIGVNNPTISWLPYQTFRLDNNAAQGSGFTLAATSPGGHFYTLVSTGAAAGTGAGYLTVYDEGVGQFRMVIAPNGNVGIGTSTPLARLDTRGDVFVGLTGVPDIASSPGNNLYVANDLGDAQNSFRLDAFVNNLYLVARSGSASNSGAGIRFRTADAGQGETDRMTITPAGHVGIGTTAPSEVLRVVSADVNTPAIYGESANRGVWGKSTGSSRGVYGESATGEGVFGISAAGVGVSGTSTTSDGVIGMTAVPNASRAGVVGMSTGNGGVGVTGEATTGVYGHSTSSNGVGVTGQSDIGTGLGVYGTSSSATGQGVHGDATGAGGYGVYAKNPSGMALGVEGNAAQSLDKGGLVKAMLYINGDGTVNRCFNSQRQDGGAGLPPSGLTGCGFVVTRPFGQGSYRIDFNFQVSDRFYAITPRQAPNVNIVAGFGFDGLSVNALRVETHIPDVDFPQSYADNAFVIIIY